MLVRSITSSEHYVSDSNVSCNLNRNADTYDYDNSVLGIFVYCNYIIYLAFKKQGDIFLKKRASPSFFMFYFFAILSAYLTPSIASAA